MRISQIKTLCWASNALVLLGAGYVGVHFWETYQSRATRPEVEWPEEPEAPSIDSRWPGEITGFRPIWKTPVNGLKPAPPPPPGGGNEKPKDPKAEFLAKNQCLTVVMVEGDPAGSVAYVKVPGNADGRTLRTGESLGKFTLIGFDENPDSGVPVLVFAHPELQDLVRMDRVAEPLPELFDPPPFEPVAENDLVKPEISRTEIPRRAYQDLLKDPSGRTWVVPAEETAWWQEFGEQEVFSKLVLNVATDAEGNPRGVKIMSAIGAGTPVGTGRGLNQGDTVISINGVPVRGKEDVLGYLRGDGQGLRRYEVVVESEGGTERTVVYEVERPRTRRVSR